MKLATGMDEERAAYCARRIEELKRRLALMPPWRPTRERLRIEAEIRALYRSQAELQTRRLL